MVDLSELEATNAIGEAAIFGRKQKLLAYLRSDRPLTAMDREYLADYLDGKIKRKKGRPRDLGRAFCLRQLAFLVQQRKTELRNGGERYRIHNKAVDDALKLYNAAGYPAVSRETLENHLRRSKRRRK
jgi:hypothetical protein